MGRLGKLAGLTLLMVFARYAPLGEALSWAVHGRAPAIETGSVTTSQLAQDPPRRGIILAQASGKTEAQSGSSGEGASEPKQKGPGRGTGRSRVQRDDSGTDEIFMGGTGLLADEDGTKEQAPHPLAQAHPGDFLVICEAGCRSESNRIVYQVSKAAASAAAIAQRRLELTAASVQQVASVDDAVVCVAGCYDDEPVARNKKAEASPPAHAPAHAATAPPLRQAAHQPADTTAPKAVAETPSTIVTASIEQPEKIEQPAKIEPPAKRAVRDTVVSIAQEVLAAAPAPLPQPAAEGAAFADLASAHLISAETAAHAAARRAGETRQAAAAGEAAPAPLRAVAAPAGFPRRAVPSSWRTKVTSLVFKDAQPGPVRSIVALEPAEPFETSLSIENGWQWSLVNTP